MIKIENHKEILPEDVLKVEKFFECKIPEDYLNFIIKYNGKIWGEKDGDLDFDHYHDDGWKTGDAINSVFNMQDILERTEYFLNDLQEHIDHFETKRSYVEIESLLPIIEINGGEIYISIKGKHKGTLYISDNGDFGVFKLNKTLKEMEDVINQNQKVNLIQKLLRRF